MAADIEAACKLIQSGRLIELVEPYWVRFLFFLLVLFTFERNFFSFVDNEFTNPTRRTTSTSDDTFAR